MFSLCDDAKLTKKWDKYNNKKTRLGHEDEVQGHFCLDEKNPHDIKVYFLKILLFIGFTNTTLQFTNKDIQCFKVSN